VTKYPRKSTPKGKGLFWLPISEVSIYVPDEAMTLG
jgi:hypothetical protein